MKTFFELREGTISEGVLKVQAWSPEGGGSHPKKFGLKVKKLGSSQYGGDLSLIHI